MGQGTKAWVRRLPTVIIVIKGIMLPQAGTEGITQTIRAMVLTAVVQDGHAAEGLEV